MKIIFAKDYQAMSRKAANILSAQVILKPKSVLGLATGSSPLGIYKQIIEWHKNGDIDFFRVNSVNLDEYCGLDKDSNQSYYYYMYENLFKHINIRLSNTHIPNGMEKDPVVECNRYNNVIKCLGGIDLQLLGLGHNGHIGFNEPNEAFEKETHCVKLADETIKANARFFETLENVPTHAYTMGIKSIMQAKKIVLIASGEGKANILYEALFGPITPAVPASILQLHNDLTVVADQDALSVIMARKPETIEQFTI